MLNNKDCIHRHLQFGSGDYYLFCHDCGASWMRRKSGKMEYARLPNGEPVGGAPEEANVGLGGHEGGTYRIKP